MFPEPPGTPGVGRTPRAAHDSAAGSAGVGGLLQQHQAGVRDASDELVALVAAEIRVIAAARERDRGPLTSADEQLANLLARILSDCALAPDDRPPFLAVYARAVRRVVCEHLARHSGAMEGDVSPGPPDPRTLLAIDGVLHSLERVNPRLVTVVECLYFARLTDGETAAALRTQPETVRRDWARARAWLLEELAAGAGAGAGREVSVANAVWVDAVLRSAVALSPEERDAFLAQCHAAAPGLRHDVEDLLRLTDPALPGPQPGELSAEFLWSVLAGAGSPSAETAPPFEDAPVLEPATSTEDVPEPKAQDVVPSGMAISTTASGDAAAVQATDVEGWRIVASLQDGGTGQLFLAERIGDDIKGTVRVLPIRSNPSGLAIFNDRCRRLAAIDHPGIARLLDYGVSSEGQYYLVHAAADGCPLVRYCAFNHLDVEARVHLLVGVCAALQAAHRTLVAHGSLSASSILVDNGGGLAVLDCGVEPLATSLAEAGGDASAGSPVAASADVRQAGVLLRTLVARRAGPRGAAVDADLETIIQAAIEEDVRARYPSIGAFRGDLQRWLDRRPVLARRGSAAYRGARFVSRRRIPLAIGAALALTVAVLLPPRIAESRQAARDADRAAAVDRVVARMFDDRISPSALADPPGAKTYVDRAAALVRTELTAQPARQAGMLLTIGRAYSELGAFAPAVATLEEALLLARQSHGEDSTEVAEILEPLGLARHALGRYDEAEPTLRTARAIRLLRAGPAHPATVSANVQLAVALHRLGRVHEAEQILRTQLDAPARALSARSDPASNEVATQTGVALAGVLGDRGLFEESEALYRQALESSMAPESAASVHTAKPAHLRPRGSARDLERARAQVGLSRLLIARGEMEEAPALLLEAIQTLRRLHGLEHPILIEALRTQARLRLLQSRLGEARSVLADAQRIHQQSIEVLTLDVPATRALQAELAFREGRLADAVATSRLALDEFDRLELANHPLTIDVRAVLGEALIAMGRRAEAVPVLGRAVSAAEGLVPAGDPRILRLRTAVVRASGSRGLR